MDHAQHRVAGLDVGDDDAERAHVVQLGEIELLAAHLLPDAVDVLGPAADLGADTRRRQFRLQALDRGLHEAFAQHALFFEHLGDALVGVRLDHAEGQVFQLPLQLEDAEPVGERRVQVEHLAPVVVGDRVETLALGKKAQRGRAGRQAHQHHAHVGGHRQQHLAQGFDLGHGLLGGVLAAPDRGLGGGQVAQADQLVHAAHHVRDFLAEAAFELVGSARLDQRQLEQQAGDAGLGIDPQQGQRAGDTERELERPLAGAGQAFAVVFGREIERGLHARAVLRPEAMDQLGGGVAERGNRYHAARALTAGPR